MKVIKIKWFLVGCLVLFFGLNSYAGIKAISAGNSYTVALKEDGRVVAWGDNSFGQCNVPDGLIDVVAISAGGGHTVALKRDGRVVAWGYNRYGQCNVPAEEYQSVFILDRTIHLGSRTHGVFHDPIFNKIYVARWEDFYEWIYVLNGTTYEIEKILDYDVSPNYHDNNHASVVVSSDGRYVYTSDYYAGTISQFDVLNNYNKKSIWFGCWPCELTINKNGSKIYALFGCDGRYNQDTGSKVVIVDTRNFSPNGAFEIILPEAIYGEVHGLVLSPNEEYLYLKSFRKYDSTAYVHKLDLRTATITNTIEIPFCNYGFNHGISITPDGLYLLVTIHPDKVLILDAVNLSERKLIKVGNQPDGVDVSPDGKYAVVVNRGDGTISVIDMETKEIVQTLYAGPWITEVQFDSSGKKFFVTTYSDDIEPTMYDEFYIFTKLTSEIYTSPSSYNFGSVTIGNQVSKTFYVQNNGNKNVQFGSLNLEGDTDFYIINDSVSGKILSPGGTLSFSVIFKPVSTGNKKATVKIQYNSTELLSVSLSGTGGLITGTSKLKGKVYNGSTGQTLQGVSIQFGSYSGQSGADGSYEIVNIQPGNYSVIVSKEGFSSIKEEIEIPASTTVNKNFTLYPSTSGIKPIVISVSSPFSGFCYFLDGVNFDVKWTANIDWAGKTPGKVRFITPKGTYDVPTSSNTASKVFNMGKEFGSGGKLKVVAISSDGVESQVKEADFCVMRSIPETFFSPVFGGSNFYYSTSFGPNWEFINEGIEEGIIPENIPFFGGKSFNIKFIPTISGEIKGNTTNFGLAWENMKIPILKVAGFEIEGYPSVNINGTYMINDWSFSGKAGINIGFSGSTPPFYLWLVPPIYLKGSLFVDANFGLKILKLPPTPRDLTGSFNINPEVRGSAGCGASGILSVEGWIGGGAEAEFQYPKEPHFEQLTIYLNGGYTIYALLWKKEGELLRWEWTWPENKGYISEILKGLEGEKWVPVERSYLNLLDYGKFIGGKEWSLKKFIKDGEVYTVKLSKLQANIFPYSEPFLGSSGNNLYLIYLYDNPERTLNNRTECVFSSFNGVEWRQPIVIDDDGTSDFQPRIVVFDDGYAMATWTDLKTSLPDDATFEQILQNAEIKVAYYNKETNIWTNIQRLTDNNYLDCSPLISGKTKDDVICIWCSNEGNDIYGTENPGKIYWTRWNGINWSQPQVLVSLLKPLIKYELAYNGEKGEIILTLDEDKDLSTIEDRELYRITYQNGSWSELQRLTEDEVPDDNPKIIFDQNENIVLIWLKGGELSSVVNFDFNSREIIRKDEYSSNLADFKLAGSLDGKMSLVWTEPSGYSCDIWAVFYDPIMKLWGKPKQLTDDSYVEKWLTTCFYGNNKLFVVFNRTEMKEENVDRTILGGKTVKLDIPKPGTTDLYVLQYTMGEDIAVVQNTFKVDPLNPAIGQSVTFSIDIVNLGDKSVSNIPVAFYLGNPSQGGIEIGRVIIEETLTPGLIKNIIFDWIIPQTEKPLDIYALVDPEFNLSEDKDRNNNIAYIRIVKPDLKVENILVQQILGNFVSIEAIVSNVGSLPSTETTLTFRKNSQQNGDEIFKCFIPGLMLGEITSINFTFDLSQLTENDKEIWCIIDEENKTEEFSKQNNQIYIFIKYLFVPLGDLNFDREIDITDVIKCLRMAIGLNEVDLIGDMNEDGQIDITDVIKILRKAIGLD